MGRSATAVVAPGGYGLTIMPNPSPDARSGSRRLAVGAVATAAVVLAAILIGSGLAGAALPVATHVALASGGATSTAATPTDPTSTAASAAPQPTPATPAPSAPSSAPPSASPSANPGPYGGPAIIPADALQARLTSLQSKLGLAGVSVAILWADGRSWVGAAGLADVAGKRPVTPDSAFALASISKTYTAAVVLQLVDEGRLALDQPVAPLLPGYKLDTRITVRMLLDHTSGLPDFFLNPKIDKPLQAAPDAAWTPARSLTYLTPKHAKPGSTWIYANTNYLLLGELVTAVTGRPLATEIRDRLLDPLGLSDTWYQVVERPRATTTLGYRTTTTGGTKRQIRVSSGDEVMPFRSVITAAGGAGSIAATALDAARWMEAFAGGRMLSGTMQAAMLADAGRTPALHARVPYGLGIQVTTLDGWLALGHSGRYLGFRTVARYLPDEGITIVVLTNQGTVDPTRVATSLLKLVIPTRVPLPTPPPTAAPTAKSSPTG